MDYFGSFNSFRVEVEEQEPESKLAITKTTWLAGWCGALAGFSYGYEPPIVSGLIVSSSFLSKFWPNAAAAEGSVSDPYCTSNGEGGMQLYIAGLFLFAMVAAPLAGVGSNRAGRRTTFIAGAALLLAANVLQTAATDLVMLCVGRGVMGVAQGTLTMVAQVYVAEMTPAAYRGRFGFWFGLSAAAGQTVGYFVNLAVSAWDSPQAWRVPFASASWCSLAMLTLLIFFLPDTPSSLLQRGRAADARRAFALTRARGTGQHRQEWLRMTSEVERAQQVAEQAAPRPGPAQALAPVLYAPPFTIMLHLAVVRVWSGYVALMFFTSVVLAAAGVSTRGALLAQALVGLATVAGGIAGTFLVDRVGRRPLLAASGVLLAALMAAAALVLGLGLSTTPGSTLSTSYAVGFVVLLVAYQTAFWGSWGPTFWVLLSEIYPLEARGAAVGATMALCNLSVFAALLVNAMMLCALSFWTFVLFGGVCAYLALFAALFVPETKGSSLQDAGQLWRGHWFWRRFTLPGDGGGAGVAKPHAADIATAPQVRDM